jgi:2-oxoglutarate ferredoxin oxidoreductase subunit alpha
MTPATSIVEYLAAVATEAGIVTKHAEDEITAVCMAIGANYAGVRAMTATSGGGFSLMTEALGLAGMTEVPPIVIVDAQRGRPSTGLPTRTEQADL